MRNQASVADPKEVSEGRHVKSTAIVHDPSVFKKYSACKYGVDDTRDTLPGRSGKAGTALAAMEKKTFAEAGRRFAGSFDFFGGEQVRDGEAARPSDSPQRYPPRGEGVRVEGSPDQS